MPYLPDMSKTVNLYVKPGDKIVIWHDGEKVWGIVMNVSGISTEAILLAEAKEESGLSGWAKNGTTFVVKEKP